MFVKKMCGLTVAACGKITKEQRNTRPNAVCHRWPPFDLWGRQIWLICASSVTMKNPPQDKIAQFFFFFFFGTIQSELFSWTECDRSNDPLGSKIGVPLWEKKWLSVKLLEVFKSNGGFCRRRQFSQTPQWLEKESDTASHSSTREWNVQGCKSGSI